MGTAASGEEGGGGGGGRGRSTYTGGAHSAFQAACIYSDIDTTKVDVGAYASRIRAAQQPIPVRQAKTVHRIMDSHDCYVRIIVWDPFRELLISGGGDGWIRMWKISDYTFVDELEARLSVRSLVVLTNELASGHSNGEVIIWSMEEPGHPVSQRIKAHEEAVYGIVVLRSGELVTGAEDIRVFSRGMFGFSHVLTIEEEVLCMCGIPGSSQVVTGNMNSLILVWDSAENWEVTAECKGHQRSVWSVAYINDCARCASGSADHSIRIWNPANWECERVLSDHNGWVVSLSVAPGMLLSASIDQGIRAWNVKTWQCERTFTDQEYEVYCVCAFSGGRFCTGGAEMAILIYGGPEYDRPQMGNGGVSFPGLVPTSRGPGSRSCLKDVDGPETSCNGSASAGQQLAVPSTSPQGSVPSTAPRGVNAEDQQGAARNLPSTWGGASPQGGAAAGSGLEWMNLPEWVTAPIATVTGSLTPRGGPDAGNAKAASSSGKQDLDRDPHRAGYPDHNEASRGRQQAPPQPPPQLDPQQRRRQLQAGCSELDFTISDFREHLVEVEEIAKVRERQRSESRGRQRSKSPAPSALKSAASSALASSPTFGGPRGRGASAERERQGASPHARRAPSPRPQSKAAVANQDDMMDFETWKAVPNARDLGLEPAQPVGTAESGAGVTEWSSALLSRGRS